VKEREKKIEEKSKTTGKRKQASSQLFTQSDFTDLVEAMKNKNKTLFLSKIHRVNLNSQAFGKTPLDYAILYYKDDLFFIETLLKQGAIYNIPDKTPIPSPVRELVEKRHRTISKDS